MAVRILSAHKNYGYVKGTKFRSAGGYGGVILFSRRCGHVVTLCLIHDILLFFLGGYVKQT